MLDPLFENQYLKEVTTHFGGKPPFKNTHLWVKEITVDVSDKMSGKLKTSEKLVTTVKAYAEETPFQHVADTSKVIAMLKIKYFKMLLFYRVAEANRALTLLIQKLENQVIEKTCSIIWQLVFWCK